MNIDDGVSLFQEFLTAVCEQDVAALTESDEQLQQRFARTESFMYAPPGTTMTSTFGRPGARRLRNWPRSRRGRRPHSAAHWS